MVQLIIIINSYNHIIINIKHNNHIITINNDTIMIVIMIMYDCYHHDVHDKIILIII